MTDKASLFFIFFRIYFICFVSGGGPQMSKLRLVMSEEGLVVKRCWGDVAPVTLK